MLPPAALRPSMKVIGRWVFSPDADWKTRRRRMTLAAGSMPAPLGTIHDRTMIGGVPVERLTTRAGTGAGVLLYLHGGGYCVGTAAGYRNLAARLGLALECEVVVVDYRLAPEHPWPAQRDDALAVYEGLLAEGVDPGRILVAGDSAGGHLSLALALKLREAGRPQPAALGLICPWLDLRESAMARRPESPREPFLSREIMAAFTRDTLRDPADGDDPLTSPVLADLEGLAPIVLHSSGDDPLAVEADELARRAAEQGVALEHRRFDGVWHVVHLHEPFLRGVGAVEALTASLRRHLKS